MTSQVSKVHGQPDAEGLRGIGIVTCRHRQPLTTLKEPSGCFGRVELLPHFSIEFSAPARARKTAGMSCR